MPLVRDHVGFGVLGAGRGQTDKLIAPLSDREAEKIADCTHDMSPTDGHGYWFRNLKPRLRTLP